MSDTNLSPIDSPQSRSKSRWVFIIVFIIVIALLVTLIWHYVLKPKQTTTEEYNPWRQPVPVRVVPLSRADMQLELKAVGTVLPTQMVTVQSQVSGILKALYFTDGQYVEKGQLLAQIDPASFEVALAQAVGNQQQQQAQLQHAQAELKRYQTILKEDAIPKQQVDEQLALVNQLRGQSQALQAQIDAAKLQLSYSRIYAPISGKVGFRQKDVGNLIQANDAQGIVTIAQTSPIYVQFAIAENYLDLVRESSGKAAMVDVWDRQEQQRLAIGKVYALDNQIDSNTGTLKIKAVIPNSKGELYPNQFVNIRLQAQTLHDAVTVPSDAIQHGAKGTYVYIVDAENKAQIRTLELGMSSNGQTQVLSGLTGNEKVVLEGIDRLSEGRAVQITEQDGNTAVDASTEQVQPTS